MAARILRWTACALLALGAVACGGGDDEGGGGGASDAGSPAAVASADATAADAGASEAVSDGGGDRGAADGDTYTVRSGDTLYGIALDNDTTVEALVRANDLDDPDVLDIGQQLVIPTGGG